MSTRHTQDNGLGDWHPARRPDSQGYSPGHYEHTAEVPLDPVSEEEAGAEPFAEDTVLTSEAPTEYQSTAQPAPEDGRIESSALDGAHSPQEVPFAFGTGPAHRDASEDTIGRHDNRILAGQRSPTKFAPANNGSAVVDGDESRSAALSRSSHDESHEGHQGGATEPQPGLSRDTPNYTATIVDAKSTVEERADLNRFNRTNSFPDVPTLPQFSLPPQSLSRSQAETIMEEYDQEEANGAYDDTYGEASTLVPRQDDPAPDIFYSSGTDAARHVFFPSMTLVPDRSMPLFPAEEARFEEGLPLMQESNETGKTQGRSVEAGSQQRSQYLDHYAEDGSIKKSVGSVPEEESSSRPKELDRKTTNQVLESMKYPPPNETQAERQPFDERPSLADLTRGAMAVSPSVVASQITSEHQPSKLEPNSKDEDLAALWQAALDDDELLDEDGEGDPSSLFDDDGEGFLEDEMNYHRVQQASPPLFQPAYTPGGGVQGFGNANSTSKLNGLSAPYRYTPDFLPRQQHQSSPEYQPEQAYGSMKQQPFTASNGLTGTFSAPTGFRSTNRQQPPPGDVATGSRPQMPSSTQSFADKAKGGYTSPYDLPTEVSRPKRRNFTQQLRPGSSASTNATRPPAPPRSSSMFASGAPVAESPASAPFPHTQPTALHSRPTLGTAASAFRTKGSAGSFFEELPIVKRSSMSAARSHTSTPPQNLAAQSPSLPPHSQQANLLQSPASDSSSSSLGYGFVPPRPISPYASIPHQASTDPALSRVSSRYSPAPVASSNIPPPRTRYAASPAGGTRAPPPTSLPFQPRTSSPLAQNNVGPKGLQGAAYPNDESGRGRIPAHQESTGQQYNAAEASFPVPRSSQPLEQMSDYGASPRITNDQRVPPDRPFSSHFSPPLPPTTRYGPTSSSATPSHAVNTPGSAPTPSNGPSSGLDSQYTSPALIESAPPRRSQTQSPGGATSKPSLPSATRDIYQRPASVNDRTLPQQALMNTMINPHGTGGPKGRSQTSEYIKPTDGRENDPLERWKGCPLFAFGFGGTVVTSFPKRVQRYAAGHNAPLMKCSPGEVKIQPRKAYVVDNSVTSFPGPLKSKGKKKDVLEWLQQQIQQFEQNSEQVVTTAVPDPRKRNEEKVVLWKIIRTLVESDGVIEGNQAAEQAVRLILSPELAKNVTLDLPPSSNPHLSGISRAGGPKTIPASIEIGDIETLRLLLLQGERDKAVWHALDRRLWAHAMLISSTMDKAVWKQVVQEFVRQEVKSLGNNTESLASLYQIFAGNWDESVDELVPPSARAGLQLVSKAAGTGPTRNALDGLERWRETLALALSNRTSNDGQALVALGRLLSGYGRAEAAHICFIFAKVPGIFGGSDDPQAAITLLGADHAQRPFDFSRDIDSILLTEVYEFACTILAPSPSVTISPHLQAYKLYHAMMLVEHGSRADAQDYCSAVTSAMKSTTKLSPYYHSLLFTTLDDLVNRLRQAPSASSASWMSKPSLDKVSGSFLSRVNQFIAGDESDADSAASGKGSDPAAGPFAGATGDTPNISRSPSTSDLYSGYPLAQPLANPVASTSRYAPGGQYAAQGQYTPRSSFEQNYGNVQDHRGPLPSETLRPKPSGASRPNSSGNVYQQLPQQPMKQYYKPMPQPTTYPPQQEKYPTPPPVPEPMPVAPSEELSSSSYGQEAYLSPTFADNQPSQHSYRPLVETQPDSNQKSGFSLGKSAAPMSESIQSIHRPPTHNYDPSPTQETSSSYEPPTANYYEPPVYGSDGHDLQDDKVSPVQDKPNKKAFMNDDDDFEARANDLLKQEKVQKDREADDAFRKAAEADGMLSNPFLTETSH